MVVMVEPGSADIVGFPNKCFQLCNYAGQLKHITALVHIWPQRKCANFLERNQNGWR